MLLSYNELYNLVKDNVITKISPELINGTSIDITLGNTILLESNSHKYAEISLKNKENLSLYEHKMKDDGYVLSPGEFILANSEQIFNLPLDISAEYKLKSSMARIGLEHLNAGWCDAGWNGSVLTLELINCSRFHSIKIRPGDRVGQVVFFKHEPVPKNVSYIKRGRYNNDIKVSGVKK